MSRITGGIFSKPSGKTGGIVFGAARTRQGKVATARELVSPSNPNTPAQQTQRGKFKSSLDLIRRFGAGVYQVAWNRSIGQLPGFQSMVSVVLNQMAANKDITLVTEINLGTLHFPDSFVFASPDTGELQVDYTTELGANGTAADIVSFLIFAKTDANRELVAGVVVNKVFTRTDVTAIITNLIVGETYEIYAYMQGVGTADGLFSVANVGSQLISA